MRQAWHVASKIGAKNLKGFLLCTKPVRAADMPLHELVGLRRCCRQMRGSPDAAWGMMTMRRQAAEMVEALLPGWLPPEV